MNILIVNVLAKLKRSLTLGCTLGLPFVLNLPNCIGDGGK